MSKPSASSSNQGPKKKSTTKRTILYRKKQISKPSSHFTYSATKFTIRGSDSHNRKKRKKESSIRSQERKKVENLSTWFSISSCEKIRNFFNGKREGEKKRGIGRRSDPTEIGVERERSDRTRQRARVRERWVRCRTDRFGSSPIVRHTETVIDYCDADTCPVREDAAFFELRT